jgi:flagellar biosynthesis protein FlhF
MGFRRYVASNARDALDRVRRELGADAVILSNRRIDAKRMEIIAAAPDEMRALVDDLHPVMVEPPPEPGRAPARPSGARAGVPRLATVTIPRKTPPEPFAEFIRRQSRPRVPNGGDAVAMYASMAPAPAPVPAPSPTVLPSAAAAVFRRRPSRLDAPVERRSPDMQRREPLLDLPARSQPAATAQDMPPRDPVMAELRALRSSLSDRIAHLESDVAARAQALAAAHALPADAAPSATTASTPTVGADAGMPVAAGRPAAVRATVARMLMSGFSPELARRVGVGTPPDLDAEGAARWLQAALAAQIRCPGEAENPLQAPGAIALTGPTGVGKTTTIAKLAARWVVRHGAAGLGLVTLDSYRMGAHEQLRSYGRILGVPVHSAQDASTLADLLRSLQERRLVLIDTCGMSQRDARLSDMLALLGAARFRDQPIGRVLLLNAASHAETLDEVSRGWQVESTAGCIVTKIDEAARIGGALDSLIRYRAPLLGLTNGQRVPEDWHAGNAALLAHLALKPFGAAFCLEAGEVQSLSTGPQARVAHA